MVHVLHKEINSIFEKFIFYKKKQQQKRRLLYGVDRTLLGDAMLKSQAIDRMFIHYSFFFL